ncbi:phage tail terminator family protein [Paenibacillus oleatilyticus]|uniref:phage tail terminator family protein n=1 Tax=Paenibacillus oleatilyticus TaxID=2594886 RepID=UPI001C1FC5AE|nr:hypothetical protein [Paenibacillus oleatilyticus]MBU7320279.1 hypothetical protein [Paenibacillus oleatilyticus]
MARLTRAQLNKAVNERISAEFPDISIQSSDVEEGFERPSFFVEIDTDASETFQFTLQRDMTCRILFFPTDRNEFKEEVYDVQDRLEKMFGLNFSVLGRTITIDEAETFVMDRVLHYDFRFAYFDDAAPEETGEKMQELGYNG